MGVARMNINNLKTGTRLIAAFLVVIGGRSELAVQCFEDRLHGSRQVGLLSRATAATQPWASDVADIGGNPEATHPARGTPRTLYGVPFR